MAVIQVESVAITKSRLAKGFNGDNLNLNGKVISSQEADAGFKAAGNVKPPYVAVLASGNQKGFAAGAAAAFNDYVKDVNINKHNAEAVINRFFDDMDSVVEKCSIDGARLSIGIVCAYDDCVVAAKTGNCHLLRFSEGELFEIALSDDDGGRGFQFVDVIADGDVFALIGEESATDLDYDGIVNVFDQGNELKLAVRDIFKLLSTSARGKDCSVVLMKLNCDSERTYAVLPVADNSDAAFDSALSESPEDFVVSDDEEFFADEVPEEKTKKSSKKKILGLIPVVILVILLAVAAGLYFATQTEKNNKGEEGSSSPDIIVNAPEEDSTADFNGSNGMQTVEDNGPGGDAGEIDKETTTNAPETTTKRPSTPSTRPSTPSTRPSTTQPSTSAPETTTAAPETTTAAPETTTVNTETTTQAPETTTQAQETTTQEPVTQAPTTQAPAETPAEPANEEPVVEE